MILKRRLTGASASRVIGRRVRGGMGRCVGHGFVTSLS
jgi:hypothetical protein